MTHERMEYVIFAIFFQFVNLVCFNTPLIYIFFLYDQILFASNVSLLSFKLFKKICKRKFYCCFFIWIYINSSVKIFFSKLFFSYFFINRYSFNKYLTIHWILSELLSLLRSTIYLFLYRYMSCIAWLCFN